MFARLKAFYQSSKPFRSFVYTGVGVAVSVLTSVGALQLTGPAGAVVGGVATFIAAQLGSWMQSHAETDE